MHSVPSFARYTGTKNLSKCNLLRVASGTTIALGGVTRQGLVLADFQSLVDCQFNVLLLLLSMHSLDLRATVQDCSSASKDVPARKLRLIHFLAPSITGARKLIWRDQHSSIRVARFI